MGVPKFFRYISERYPCLSEFVEEHQIPDFDNLYLDMNGIIHNCSHPDDGDAHFRITEEKIFADIFHYVDVLFRMIKPQRLFFMAVDGVAPRAKMNQQRGRRFRSAKEAEKLEWRAKKLGQVLPEEARFDSNCITPGTVFMAKLHKQLKYFIVNKITTNKLWRRCEVILSGHDTPGEGEHKIMDYIRYLKAQPGYDPNTRHCLYGLDADLIMLGMCTHEQHFSLLREKVVFGRKSQKRQSAPEQISFYLLHLSMMRGYLELEFGALKTTLPFEFDIERVIDDWVLMSFLVGNDFIPHLPNMHIADGALPVLYNAYIHVLPTLDGYINVGGHLHLDRFERFLNVLKSVDMDNFWKQRIKKDELEEYEDDIFSFETMETKQPINMTTLIRATDESEEPEDAEFVQHKLDYYMHKLQYQEVTSDILRAQAVGYVRAIQWTLSYYYNGVCSWGWYYSHHYAPFVSDIKDFKDVKFDFELGTPFKPYEQLLAVLPVASKNLLPKCYRSLMTKERSIIKSYYPVDFETDLNGKKQDWEAVVLIPFIDEKLLLEAMLEHNKMLTPKEIKRNNHGPMLMCTYTELDNGDYKAPQYFPVVKHHHAFLRPIDVVEIRVPMEKVNKGMKTDVNYLGFPTMNHLSFTSALEKAQVKVFDQRSRGESVILHLDPVKCKSIEDLARELLGKKVFVAWPHLVEASVTRVSSKQFRYHKSSTEGEYNLEENRGNIDQHWDIERGGITEHYRDHLGIEVGETDILVHVRSMIGRKYIFTQNGRVSLEKQWSKEEAVYPLQTIVMEIQMYNQKYTSYKNVEEVFVLDSNCFMLGQPHYGRMGTVKNSTESLRKGRIKMSVKVCDEPDFASVRLLEDEILAKYFMPPCDVASKLGISDHLLSRITGILLVIPGQQRPSGGIQQEPSKINIGLNLTKEEITGYTKKVNGLVFSQKVVELVQQYMELYPRLVEKLKRSMGYEIYEECELFPEDEGSGKTVNDITIWLKKLHSLERKPCGSIVLDVEIVTAVEAVVDTYLETQNMKSIVMQVKPHLLFKPDIQMCNSEPDPSASYQLYDRVVNIKEDYPMPLGLSGTVIAVHKDMFYDVVFDKSFVGGTNLNCSNNRGYRMSRQSLINLSYGRRQLELKTESTRQLLEQYSLQDHPDQSASQSDYQERISECASKNMQQNSLLRQTDNFLHSVYNEAHDNIQQPHMMPDNQNQSTMKSQQPGPNPYPQMKKTNSSHSQPAIDSKFENGVEKQLISKTKNGIKQLVISTTDEIGQKQDTEKDNYYTKVLMELYQAQGYGCPRYLYFDTPEDNFFQAHLAIPIAPFENKGVFGQPATTRELACDNVAKDLLSFLKGKSAVKKL